MSQRRASAWLLLAFAILGAGRLAGFSASQDEPVLALSLASAAVELCIAGVALAAALYAPGAPRERLGLVRSRLGAREIAALALGTLGLSHALDATLALSGLYEQSSLADFARSVHGARGLPLAAAVLAIGLAPALAEELLCRGVLLRSLVPRVGAAPAIGLSALAFGALHLEPVHGAFALLLGVYLGLAGYWSGSVVTPIACHAVNNLFALGVSVQGGPTLWASAADVAAGFLLALAALAWVRGRRQSGLQPRPGSVDA